MEEKEKFLEFEITIKERTSWGLTHKSFSNYTLQPNRFTVFVDFINYISKKYQVDYLQAVKILRKQR